MTRRVLLSYVALTAFLLVVLGVPLGVSVARSERADLIARVERDATVLASVVEDGLQHGTPVDFQQIVRQYASRTAARVVIVDSSGVAVGDSDPLATTPRDFSTRPEIGSALEGLITSGYRRSDTLDTRLLYVAVPVASGGQVHGAVRITYPTTAVDARISRSWLTLAGVSAVGLAAAAVVAAATARWVNRPVRDLHRAAQQLAAGDLSARVGDRNGPPEIRTLGRTVDQMAARLEDLLTSQRAFVADASHQLRSPLTALRLRLEGITDATPATQVRVDAAIEEAARLGRLVDGLLALARAEGSTSPREVVDVDAVVRERTEAWEPLAAESDIRLVASTQGSAVALGAPGALQQILDNYLDNALAVAPPASTVEIRARRDGDRVIVEVSDEGPGLTDEQRGRAFDRFWRGPDHDHKGFGLGLAIVTRLATASGGHADLRASAQGHGTIASITLPASKEAPRVASPW